MKYQFLITLSMVLGEAIARSPFAPRGRSPPYFLLERLQETTNLREQLNTIASLRGGDSNEVLNIVCTLRGKKYDVSASSVADIWAAIEDQAGLEPAKQGVIFKGKKMTNGAQSLAEVGISEGDIINIVPQRKLSSTTDVKTASALADVLGEDESESDLSSEMEESKILGTGAADLLEGMGDDAKEQMTSMLENMGGEKGLKDMMKQMGLDGPMTPDKIDNLMKQIKSIFANPAIAQLFENPEILEQSRQHILNNPMMMSMYDKMGMGGLIRDPDTFRKQMESMKQMIENPELFKQAAEGLSDNTIDEFDEGEL